MQAWLPARDALLAMHSARPAVTVLLRAATAAVSGGDPASALAILAAALSKVLIELGRELAASA